MVELRKRKTPPPAAEKPAKKAGKPKSTIEKVKEVVTGKDGTTPDPAPSQDGVSLGNVINLSGFGGEVETHDGQKVTLRDLVEKSKAGVVLFTYPKASTSSCTKQACLFRDSYEPITNAGLDIYGLSSDSPKANTNFKTKQNLQYPLLCHPSYSLIKAINLRKAGPGTQRGVFVVDKSGKVLASEPGGPDATLSAVIKVINGLNSDKAAEPTGATKPVEDEGPSPTVA